MNRIPLFLAAPSLSAAGPPSAPALQKLSFCKPPACFASPGCCTGEQCDSWCGGPGLGAWGGNGSGGVCFTLGDRNGTGPPAVAPPANRLRRYKVPAGMVENTGGVQDVVGHR